MRIAYGGKTAMDGRSFYQEASLHDIYTEILAKLILSIIILLLLVFTPVFLVIYFFFVVTSNEKQAGSY